MTALHSTSRPSIQRDHPTQGLLPCEEWLPSCLFFGRTRGIVHREDRVLRGSCQLVSVTNRLWHLVSVEKMCGQPSRLAARTWAPTFGRCWDEPGVQEKRSAESRKVLGGHDGVCVDQHREGVVVRFRDSGTASLNTATVHRPSPVILARPMLLEPGVPRWVRPLALGGHTSVPRAPLGYPAVR